MFALAYPLSNHFYYLPQIVFVDTVTNTVSATVDTTKNVAASAVDKGSAFVGSAKGIFTQIYYFCVVLSVLYHTS